MTKSKTEQKWIIGLSCFMLGVFFMTIMSIAVDRNKPLVSLVDIQAGELIEIQLPISVNKSVSNHNPKYNAFQVFKVFTDNAHWAFLSDVILEGDVKYILNGEVATFFDEAHIVYLLRKDLMIITIKSEEFVSPPSEGRYKIFARVPKNGYTKEFHNELNSLLEKVGKMLTKTSGKTI